MAPCEEIHVGIGLTRWDTRCHNRVSHRMDSPTSVTASAAAAAAAAVAAAATVNLAQPNRSRGRPKQTADEAAKSHQKTLQKNKEREAAKRSALKQEGGAPYEDAKQKMPRERDRHHFKA